MQWITSFLPLRVTTAIPVDDAAAHASREAIERANRSTDRLDQLLDREVEIERLRQKGAPSDTER